MQHSMAPTLHVTICSADPPPVLTPSAPTSNQPNLHCSHTHRTSCSGCCALGGCTSSSSS